MPPMDMTPQDRERLAARLVREQRVRFSGVAKDAYTAAGVNSATWKRAVDAESIKPHKLVQIVVKLWPETFGDWTKIPDLEPASTQPSGTAQHLVRLIDDYLAEHPQASDVQVADATGMPARTISQWRSVGLRGELPNADVLRRLAGLLGVADEVTFYAAGVDAGYIIEPDEPDDELASGFETGRLAARRRKQA